MGHASTGPCVLYATEAPGRLARGWVSGVVVYVRRTRTSLGRTACHSHATGDNHFLTPTLTLTLTLTLTSNPDL